jgi:16S rRNA (uracil1498-N3)-methyltransferase
MNLFYAHPDDVQLPLIKLNGQESKHASIVLRHRTGYKISITDGRGNLFQCRIKEIDKNSLTAEVENSSFEEASKPVVTLFLGLIKKRDRLEFAIEKCVELGVDKILLFKGDHSEKQNVRVHRIEATVLSAMKQSLRYYLPTVSVSESLKDGLNQAAKGATIVVADETSEEGSIQVKNSTENILVIGPEGGFSIKEREELYSAGAKAYSLGKKRLRAETAAISIVDRFKSGRI